MPLFFRKIQFIFLFFPIVACTTASELKPFSSDGCSLFPDASLISDKDWCSCCFEHDKAYWMGGTSEERLKADQQLKECVFKITDDAAFAELMYRGVRAGGSPYFYNWYRWGYGWNYKRKYQALTESELKLAQSMLEDFYMNKKLENND